MYGREELVDYSAGEHPVLKGCMPYSFSMTKDEIWHKSLFSLTCPCRYCQSNQCTCCILGWQRGHHENEFFPLCHVGSVFLWLTAEITGVMKFWETSLLPVCTGVVLFLALSHRNQLLPSAVSLLCGVTLALVVSWLCRDCIFLINSLVQSYMPLVRQHK